MFIVLLFTIIIGCKKNNTVPVFDKPKTFSEIFDSFWFGMNKNYAFWDLEKLHWDELYLKYKPLFDSLNLSIPSDEIKSFQYFKSMTDSLSDGHFNIAFKSTILKDSILYPSYFRIKKKNSIQVSYLRMDTAYLDSGYMFAADNNFSFGGVPLTVVCGTIRKNILFFSCSSFNLFKSYWASRTSSVKPVIDYFFSLLSNGNNLKGVIIDVRNNQGGDLNDLNFLVGRFVDSPLHFGYTRYKTGNGRFDFTPWIESFVNPTATTLSINPIKIVLTDRYSASLSEVVSMAIRVLPKSYIVGDTSWGATGALVAKEIYNSGQFSVGDFMDIKESSICFKYIDNKIYEGIGYPPDFCILPTKADLDAGKDKQLEKAISLVK